MTKNSNQGGGPALKVKANLINGGDQTGKDCLRILAWIDGSIFSLMKKKTGQKDVYLVTRQTPPSIADTIKYPKVSHLILALNLALK